MDDNFIDKGFYFVFLWFLIKLFIDLFYKKIFNKNYFCVIVKKIFKLLVNVSNG